MSHNSPSHTKIFGRREKKLCSTFIILFTVQGSRGLVPPSHPPADTMILHQVHVRYSTYLLRY